MERFGANRHRWLRYRLAAPYVVVVALIGVVGYQATSLLFAETLTGGRLRLTVDQPRYQAGDNIRFTIHNDLEQTVYVANNCPNEPLEVYRLQAGQWLRVHDAADPAKCVGEPRTFAIAARGQASASYRYWPKLFETPGRYRLVAPIEHYDDRPAIEFEVLARQR